MFFRCPECGWPMCDEKCAKGRGHEIECATLKAATKKVFIGTEGALR